MGKQIALVTGGNKGLGKEVVRQLAKHGMTVYLGSRDTGRGEAAARSLVEEGLDVIPLRLDVTENESVESVASELRRSHGRLDVLVNNAGVLVSRPAFDITADDMKDTYDTNVFGVVRMIRAMLGLLQPSVAPRIINVASTTASLTLSSDATTMFGREDTIVAYASSKAAVTMLTTPGTALSNKVRRLLSNSLLCLKTGQAEDSSTLLAQWHGNDKLCRRL
jgi:NAD(P)-dependent dehydrogenase (short-subunit alcohol dehydrogenase family)